ncbi:MAG: hypothetical protein WCT46_05755 [Candidatus Gracilibacteria bacterium]|jgi:hypothetical protein
MLTHTDIHYLVGLLTKSLGSEDIEVELGDMVYDIAGKKHRDVDVTVKQKNADGTVSMYKGIEVKDETRPLGIGTVEQLCLKLNDMPQITHKAVVSSSGYSSGAIEKATSHGMDLLEIVDWDPVKDPGFSNIIFQPGFTSSIKEKITDGDTVVRIIDHLPVWKMLRDYSTNKPIAACGIVILNSGNILGYSIIGEKGIIGSLNIQYSDRQTGRLYKKIVT